MGKLMIVMICGMGAALYFPDSRQAILEKAMPVLTPVLEWNAKKEMDEIGRAISQRDNLQRRVPSKREWLPYLESNFNGDASIDPWGSTYQFHAWRDSFAIISYGADREARSSDDIFKVFERN